MQIFQDNETILKQKFGLSAMAVVVVGLLRHKNIQITEPVLELCRPNEPLAGLLKDRLLVMAMDKNEDFQALQAKYDPEHQFPLVVLDHGSHRVLALQDEVLAEAGWKQQSEEQNRSLQTMSQDALANPELHLQGLEHLFQRDELNKLKLCIATAVKPEEKIEAIRKMTLAKESKAEKALLFLHALGDLQWAVQREAAQSLRSIGVHSELVDAILLLGGSDAEKRQAFHNLGLLFVDVNDFEKGVILQVLLTAMQTAENRRLAKYLLATLTKIVPQLPGQPIAMMERMGTATIELLLERLNELLEPVSLLFSEMSQRDADWLYEFLNKHVSKQEPGRLRSFLLSQMATLGKTENIVLRAKEIALEFGAGDMLDPVNLRLAQAIVQLKSKMVPALLDRLQISSRATEQIAIIKILDQMHAQSMTAQATEILAKNSTGIGQSTPDGSTPGKATASEADASTPQASSNILDTTTIIQVAMSYLHIFPKVSETVRLVLLDNEFIPDPIVPVNIQQEFAVAALMEIQREKFDQYPEAVKAMLCRIKAPAIVALLQVLERPLKPNQLQHDADILGQVTLTLGQSHTTQLQEIQQFCLRQIEKQVSYSAYMFVVLGKVAAAVGASSELAEGISEYLLNSIYHSPTPYAVLDGLGWAISTAATCLETKTDVAHLFIALLDRRLPEHLCKVQKVGEDNVMIFDKKVTAYTDMLPILLSGLRRLALSPSTSETLRKRISEYLLKKWKNIVEFNMLWGPKNTIDLAEVLSDIARHSQLQESEQRLITQALYQKINILTIAQFLVQIFVYKNSPALADIVELTAHRLLEFASDEDYRNPEDLEDVYDCIGRLVRCQFLAPEQTVSDSLRERLVYVLLDGLRDQIFGVEEILYDLAHWNLFPQHLRNEILKRMPTNTLDSNGKYLP